MQDQNVKQAAEAIVAQVRLRLPDDDKPFVVAIDGGSGSGKSTVAAVVASELDAALVPGDDFFAAHITHDGWAERNAMLRAADGIDWRRLRREALEPLVAGQPARWNPFDFVSGVRHDGTYSLLAEFVELSPAKIIILDGAYSARPELSDLVDFTVLVDVPVAVRHHRLSAREEAAWLEAWHERWDGAEDHYFTSVRPASSFDLVVTNALSSDINYQTLPSNTLKVG